MEEKCGQCHYFNSKDGICRNKQMQKECFQGDKDNILYVSREEQKCALFKAKMKNNRPLTPEILTANGWKVWYTGSYTKEIADGKMEIIFNNIGELSIFYNPYIKLKALDQITVMEFNTLLDIVKLTKFKILHE